MMDLRKIDALIAEHYMGWTEEDYVRYKRCPNYSADIGAAWEVVAKIIAEGGSYQLHSHWTDRHMHVCVITTSTGLVVSQSADTAPLAICLATLKAKGIEIPTVEEGVK